MLSTFQFGGWLYKTSIAKKREYASTQLELAAGPAKDILDLAKKIPAKDLDGDGRETEPHITIQYGIDDKDLEAVRKAVKGFGVVFVTVDDVSVFKHDGKPDVVKLSVSGPKLNKLRDKIRSVVSLDGETYKEYKPHVTLAYVKPGKGDSYLQGARLVGRKLFFTKLVFSSSAGVKTEITL